MNRKYELIDLSYERLSKLRAVSARIVLRHPDSQEDVRSSTGNGPVSAAFKAIGYSVSQRYSVVDFNIRSVGSGEDADGECNLILRNGSKSQPGFGRDSDIVKASLLAYIDALNKINNLAPIDTAGAINI